MQFAALELKGALESALAAKSPQLMRGPFDGWLDELSGCWSLVLQCYEAFSEQIAHALAAH